MKRLAPLVAAAIALGAPYLRAEPVFQGSGDLNAAIEEAVRRDELPGAVLLVTHRGQVVHRKAYGQRALAPRREPMTVDTIFDIASLTKVVATTPAIMKLVETGKLRLNDRVIRYLPEFQRGASEITVRSLLTHFSGLRGDLDVQEPWSGYETGIQKALIDKPVAAPGERFIYSDINFVLLGEIVRRLSGKPLDEYAAEIVFRPLGMKTTMFRPPPALRPRIAPTEQLPGMSEPLRGIAHDPTSRYMGGVAGHAGVFSTADDLALFTGMMLGLGSRGGVQLFSPLTIRRFTAPQSPPDQPILRGLGWDLDSPYSGPRGDLFPLGSYGHTGFTGTSIWIDPATQSSVILLAASVHPKQRPALTPLRSRVATITAASTRQDAPAAAVAGYNDTVAGAGVRRVVARNSQVWTGLDVLAGQGFSPLAGKRVGLITNQTGLDRKGRRNIDLMLAAGINVRALLSPEHGFEGRPEGEDIPNSIDSATRVPVWSLYSGTRLRPTEEMLKELDVLVFDIQDVGARFYTYISTMGYAMEESARRHIPFFVLDRPNPVNGVRVEGPMLDSNLVSFIGYFPLPLRHGMTAGELATIFNENNNLGAELHVIRMQNWQRGDWFDSTGLSWVNPSPNIRSLQAALLYPGVALLEALPDYSVGRGTDAPFEQIGAPWMDGPEVARYLNARFIPGVRFYPTQFRPQSSAFAGVPINGVRFLVTDRESFSAQRLGLEIAAALMRFYPDRVPLSTCERLIGSAAVIDALASGGNPVEIEQAEQRRVSDFLPLREKSLLY